MDYEKKLKDIINSRHTPFFDIDILCKYFPELKENKDKIIRNRIIGYLKLDIEEHPERQERLNEMITYFEKLCEQTPADNVEHKFKVGDWVQYRNAKPFLVKEITRQGYVNGNDCFPFSWENEIHLWTIQDAKDGDILIDKSGSRENPFIFKETKPSDIKTDMLNPLAVFGYCGIGGAGFTKGSGWGDTVNCIYYPATKEQRDLLFQKIKEAGYEWDAEKKELIKIKDEPVIPKFKVGDIIRHKEQGFTCKITAIDTEYRLSECNGTHLPFEFQDAYELVEQESALNEEQSTPQIRTGIEWVNTIDDACDKRYSEEYAHGEYCHEQSFKWGFQEGVEWLEEQDKKNLTDEGMIEALRTEYEKGRADAIAEMQKPVWSEEDKDYLHNINAAVNFYFDEGYAEKVNSWLKVLKESCGRGTL